MDPNCRTTDMNVKHLLGQLNTARREINNLRQQLKTLRYTHEKDVNNIKRLLELRSTRGGTVSSEFKVIRSEEATPGTSTDDDAIKFKPIGAISTWFPTKRGTPRQPGICGKAPGKLTLDNSVFTNPDHALEGLQDFSHMWILYYFHRNDSTHVRAKVAPPRLNGARTGVFSTRSPHRPCPIGLSLVRIVRIENCSIYFEGVDMVDRSPVLDIKPYIPQYDDPLRMEKFNGQPPGTDGDRLARTANTVDSIDPVFGPADARHEAREEYGGDVAESCGNWSRDAVQSADVSRDEEIALRLQAEEFQRNSNLESCDGPRSYCLAAIDGVSFLQDDDNPPLVRGTARTTGDASSQMADYNGSSTSGHGGSVSATECPNGVVRNVSSGLEVTSFTGEENRYETPYAPSDSGIPFAAIQTSRNSRLLDGADGPRTVCGTDSDLVQRRALNSRVDNSPIRMGIREAPDGEEGFQSQSLTPSLTLSNVRAASRSASNGNLTDGADNNLASDAEQRFAHGARGDLSEIRVPDWISRPRVATLSVVFNDRALMHLNEILDDKAEDQKRAIENVLREDPRSVYLRQRWGNQFYTFLIHDLHITCRFDDNRGVVTVFQVRHAGRICKCGEPEWQCLGHSPMS